MRESSAGWSDQELIERMRRNETLAFHELFWRFQTLLVRYAKQFGVQPALREETVVETLNDAAVPLMKYSTPVPRSLVAYLVGSLRHRVGASARAARRVAEGQREFTDEGEAAELLARSSSEASVRASRGQWSDPPVLSPALERLASALDEGLTSEERMILDWVARWVPQRVIAEWVGMTHGALRIRVWRLRERLREAAVVYADHLSPAERLELKDFFRRTAMLRREDVGDSAPARVRHAPAPRAQTRGTRARMRGEEGR
jgi:DNA-directed RNA polymerase specialized sigma24 family protein